MIPARAAMFPTRAAVTRPVARAAALISLLAVGLGAAGCMPAVQGQFRLVDPELLARPRPADYPDAHAVVLEDSVRFQSHWASNVEPYLEVERHFVMAVLTEKGVEWAQNSLIMRGGTELLALTARVIAPDRTVRTLGAEEIHDEILAEDRESGERVKRRVFRLPGVQVGSVLELHSVTVSKGIAWQLFDRPMRGVPVRRYEARIEGNARLKYAFKAYGTAVKPKLTPVGRNWRITWIAENLPARETEAHAPHWSLAEPWWVFRMPQAVFGGQGLDGVREWKDAVASRAIRVFLDGDPGLLRGFDPQLDLSACGDAPCRVRAAWDWVRDRTKFDGFSCWNDTLVKDAVAAGKADSYTRSVLLWGLLQQAGLEVYPAAAVLKGSMHLDRAWPATDAFNHQLVYLPAQEGLPQPLWLDPACESCEPGAVPDWIQGGQALVYSARAKVSSMPKVEADWREVVAPRPKVPAAERRRSEWTLGPKGDVTGSVTLEETGRLALLAERRLRALNAADLEAAAHEAVTSRQETGQLVSFEAPSCDRAAGRCVQQLDMRLPAFGTVTGEQMLVPLSLLADTWDVFRQQRRTQDVMLGYGRTIEEVATLRLPEGWVVSERPADAVVSAPGVSTEISFATEGDTLTVRRVLTLTGGRHQVSEYPRIRAAVRAFSEVRGGLLVLRRQAAAD